MLIKILNSQKEKANNSLVHVKTILPMDLDRNHRRFREKKRMLETTPIFGLEKKSSRKRIPLDLKKKKENLIGFLHKEKIMTLNGRERKCEVWLPIRNKDI
jgi:hypothetical protein